MFQDAQMRPMQKTQMRILDMGRYLILQMPIIYAMQPVLEEIAKNPLTA